MGRAPIDLLLLQDAGCPPVCTMVFEDKLRTGRRTHKKTLP